MKESRFKGGVARTLKRSLAELDRRFAGGRAGIQRLGEMDAAGLPTMSLYLEDAFRASGLGIDWRMCQCGPSSYQFNGDIVLIRYATRAELDLAEELKDRGGQVIYVVDDDLEGIAGDSNLPAEYRRRIENFLSLAWDRIESLAGEMVVSSAALESRMRESYGGRVSRLDPFWRIPSEEGFARRASRVEGPVRIGWLCSRGHAVDFEAIAEEILPVLESGRDSKLIVYAGRHLPRWLRNLKGVENREPLPWPEYRRRIDGERMDLALYPLLDTTVNRSRSINKFLEHAVVGAATVCSPIVPFADRLRAGDCAFADRGEWREKLEALLDDPESRVAMARQARERARELADEARLTQLKFWRERLPGLEEIAMDAPAVQATDRTWVSMNASVARHPLVRGLGVSEGALLASRAAFVGPDDECVGWGYKASGLWAMREAERRGISFRLFEDGFVRSLQPGYGKGGIYSLVEDRSGIYYDGTGKSDLVIGLNGEGPIGEALAGEGWREEAKEDLRRYREIGVSKYNWFPGEFEEGALERSMPERGILVVDQTYGDASIRHGGMERSDFDAMLEAALDENPGVPVYLRGHPDHLFRAKRSCVRSGRLKDSRVRFIDARLSPRQVFERVEKVYAGTSLMGLEAMLHGVPVVVFGCAFYAGWGCSDDRNPRLPKRATGRSVTEIFEAAFRRYSRYYDPDTLEPCSLNRILDHLELQKATFAENAKNWVSFGMSPWKRPLMENYLASPARKLRHTRSLRRVHRWVEESPDAELLVWGGKTPESMPAAWHAEDGFLRSAGLGAEFHTPLSLIFDREGIYFDSTRPCDLESLLETREFSDDELREAKDLAELIVTKALTKYNLTEAEGPPEWPGSGVRILVPGQVECDASIEFGSPRWKMNLDLVREVRRRNPDAVLAYKPHPDVVKGLRPGEALTNELEELCDVVARGLNILPWMESCEEVHTLTSLSGFEALLRGKKVTCYGVPFYAGWGLTEDIVPVERRRRRLALEELVAGALLVYPRYVNPLTGEFTTAFGAAALIGGMGDELVSRPPHLRAIAALKRFLRNR